ncbi:MAG: hypothetical protein IIU67_09455, partial [Lachnospiraceae bacterium]|nr:hypothetical protein [Lachnospiraceae bacterium]
MFNVDSVSDIAVRSSIPLRCISLTGIRPIQSANLSFAYVQARRKRLIVILCTAHCLLEHEHEETSCNCRTDYTSYVRT